MSLPPDYTREINALNRQVLAQQPADVLQFCANFFTRRLESQRAEFLLGHQQQQSASKATFPGTNNPFGSPLSPPPQQQRSHSPVSGGAGMRSVQEEDENENGAHAASPTSARAAMEADGNKTDNAAAADNSSSSTNGAAKEAGFGNFAGFMAGGKANKSDPQSFPSNYNMNRRTSVSAESLNPASSAGDNWAPPFHQKSAEQEARLKHAVAGNFLFSHLDEEQTAQVLGALQEKVIPSKDIKVITQGDVGDYFYVVESGSFDIYVSATGKVEPGEDGMGKKVASSGPGSSFGELALMYNAPRAATVVSTEKSTLWALDRITFRRILMDSAFQRRRMYESFLEEVPLLASLTPYERSKIADALETQKFPPASTIIREGDPGESFFLLEAGEAEAFKRGIEKAVKEYQKGDYFGELALLNDAPRAASVVSKTEVKVATLGKDGFQRLLGPVEGIMRRNDYSTADEVDPLAK